MTAFANSRTNDELNIPATSLPTSTPSSYDSGTRNHEADPTRHRTPNSEPEYYQPANDGTMSDARSLLRQQQASRRITHPHALYSPTGKLSCSLCRTPVKTEALWDAHVRSPSHREALKALASAREKERASEAAGVKRKHEEEEDEEEGDAEDEERRKRSRAGPALSGASSGSEGGGSRASNTPSQGVEVSIPSRPATPKAPREGPAPSAMTPLQGKAAVDEAEWAAFEADIAAATEPYDESAVISAPAVPVGGAAEDEGEGEEGGKRRGREAEVEGEKEDAERAMAEEFDEMEELEARARKLRERREALRARASRGDLKAGADAAGGRGPEKGVDKENAAAEDGEEDDDESEDEEDDYAWGGLRYAGRV